jgi:hypothetical protein
MGVPDDQKKLGAKPNRAMAGRLDIIAFRILLRIMLTHTHLRVYMHAYVSLLTPLIG